MARLYVGTYAKYNAGSIGGAWLDLEDYSDKDEFLAACAELHKDEPDPELMFQDYEGIPKAFYGESYADPRIWEWLELDEHDRELWEVYLDNIDDKADFDTAQENFAGKADTEADFAEEWLEETGGLEAVPENLRYYIDFAAYARDMHGDFNFVRVDGGDLWVFYNR